VALKALAKEGMETDFLSLAETPIEQRMRATPAPNRLPPRARAMIRC